MFYYFFNIFLLFLYHIIIFVSLAQFCKAMTTDKTDKKTQLLQTGQELFWKHGFKKVSIDEICLKSKVSKMTFYRFFSNKTALAKAILDKVIADSCSHFREILAQENTVAEKMQQIVMMKKEGTKEISTEFISDLYLNPQPELKEYITLKMQEVWASLTADFKQAQKDGWLRSDFKPEFLLAISFKMVDLLNDKQISSLYETPQELILEITNLIAYGISPRE